VDRNNSRENGPTIPQDKGMYRKNKKRLKDYETEDSDCQTKKENLVCWCVWFVVLVGFWWGLCWVETNVWVGGVGAGTL